MWGVEESCSGAGRSGLGTASAEAAIGGSWMIIATTRFFPNPAQS